MEIVLGKVQLWYLGVFILWWMFGYFFDGESHGTYFGPVNERVTMRFITFWPIAIMVLMFHLVVLR